MRRTKVKVIKEAHDDRDDVNVFGGAGCDRLPSTSSGAAKALTAIVILEGEPSEEEGSMALLGREKEKDVVPPPLPPRYRLRDLILGDYAFNDDGER